MRTKNILIVDNFNAYYSLIVLSNSDVDLDMPFEPIHCASSVIFAKIMDFSTAQNYTIFLEACQDYF